MADDPPPTTSAKAESTVTPGTEEDSNTVILETDALLQLVDDAVNDLQQDGHFNGRNVLESAVKEANKAVSSADPDTDKFVHEFKETAKLSTCAVATLQANSEMNLSSSAFADETHVARMEAAIGAANTATTSQTQG